MENMFPKEINTLLDEKSLTFIDGEKRRDFIRIRGKLPNSPNEVLLKAARVSTHAAVRLANHARWSEQIAPKVPDDAAFGVGTVLEEGNTKGYLYCIMPYISGRPFAERPQHVSTISVDNPAQYLPTIVDLMQFIEKVPTVTIAGVDGRYDASGPIDKLHILESALNTARGDTPYVVDLLQVIQKNFVTLKTGNTHGDFTEENILITPEKKVVLIDAELSRGQYFKYYDCAEFYNRLYTRACDPDLARQFLAEYIAKIPTRSRQKFLSAFLCLSAWRCIGMFMECGSLDNSDDGEVEKRIDYTTRFAADIVSGKILQSL